MAETLRPFRPVSPGEILQEELGAREWTQSDLAEILDRPIQAVNEIITGKKAVTPATAVELARALGTSAEFWLNLEASYRLDLLHQEVQDDGGISRRAKAYSRVPVKELAKCGWIKKSKDVDAMEREICRLLEIKSLDEQPQLAVAARKSDPYDEFSPSQVAWICRARQLARGIKVKRFDRRRFSIEVAKLPRLSVGHDGVTDVPEALSRLGIRLVIVEHLSQTYIDGAAFWLDATSPVVALSLRYDRIDYFWFTLMHELAHIKQDGKRAGYLDNNLVGPSAEDRSEKPKEEQEADELSAGWLIPHNEFDTFILRTRPYYSKKAILEFADEVGVHPGIIVGRLQHLEEIPYSHSRGMLVKVKKTLLRRLAS